MYRKEINILRKAVHQVGFIYKIIMGGDAGQQNVKNAYLVFCPNVSVNENVLCFRIA